MTFWCLIFLVTSLHQGKEVNGDFQKTNKPNVLHQKSIPHRSPHFLFFLDKKKKQKKPGCELRE